MTAGSRLAPLLAGVVTLASTTLVLVASEAGGGLAESRPLMLGWVLVPAVGLAAYLRLGWGVATALGALAAPAAGAALEQTRSAAVVVAVAAGAVAVAVVVGHLARLAERRERA